MLLSVKYTLNVLIYLYCLEKRNTHTNDCNAHSFLRYTVLTADSLINVSSYTTPERLISDPTEIFPRDKQCKWIDHHRDAGTKFFQNHHPKTCPRVKGVFSSLLLDFLCSWRLLHLLHILLKVKQRTSVNSVVFII